MPFKVLIGKLVTGIVISSSSEYLKITADGVDYWFYTYGDCCSNSWIEHIDGVPALLGHTVTGNTETTCLGRCENDNYDVTRIYSVKIMTLCGVCEIEFRNSSNGYYGGSIDFMCEGFMPGSMQLRVITTDYMRGNPQPHEKDAF